MIFSIECSKLIIKVLALVYALLEHSIAVQVLAFTKQAWSTLSTHCELTVDQAFCES